MGVWVGSTFGMAAVDGIAIIAGIIAGKKLPDKLIKYISATIFFLSGIVIIIEVVR